MLLTPSWLRGLVFIVVLLALPGCAAGLGQASSAGQTPSTDYRVKVTQDGQMLAAFAVDEIKDLPGGKVSGGNEVESGPRLLAVLEKAGVKEFSRVTAVGMQKGRVHSAELTLDRAKITDQVILAINKRGTLKLTGEGIPTEGVIVDVTELQVEK